MKVLVFFLAAICLCYGQEKGRPCEEECQKKGGECGYKSPGSGYKVNGYCQSGQWGQGETCYCGYCWVKQDCPDGCTGLNGAPGVCSRKHIQGLVASGPCKSSPNEKACTCYVKPCGGSCRAMNGQRGRCSEERPSGSWMNGKTMCSKGCTCWIPCRGRDCLAEEEIAREGRTY